MSQTVKVYKKAGHSITSKVGEFVWRSFVDKDFAAALTSGEVEGGDGTYVLLPQNDGPSPRVYIVEIEQVEVQKPEYAYKVKRES